MFDVYVVIFHVWWLCLDITEAVEEAHEKHEQRKIERKGRTWNAAVGRKGQSWNC